MAATAATPGADRASRAVEAQAEQRGRTEIEMRLTFNFVWARFVCSPTVLQAGNLWQVFAGHGRADSSQCLALDHLYKQALDDSAPDLLDFSELRPQHDMGSLPSQLISSDWPKHMEKAITSRLARDRAKDPAAAPSIKSPFAERSNPHPRPHTHSLTHTHTCARGGCCEASPSLRLLRSVALTAAVEKR